MPRPVSRSFVVLVLVLGALTALGPLSIDMYLPAFPTMAVQLGVPVARIQLSLTSFFVGLAFGQMLYGPLLDRFGRKPPMYAGVAIYLLSSLACAYATTSSMLMITRFVQALGACGGMVASRAVVRDLFNETDAARVFSTLMLVMGVAPIVAPLLGGYITEAWGWRAMFALMALLSALCLIAVFRAFEETKGANPAACLAEAPQNYLRIARNPKFMGFALAGGLSQAGMFAYITGSPFVFMEIYRVPARQYGWVFGANAFGLIAASQLNARLLRRYGPERILRVAFISLAASGLALLISAQLQVGIYALLAPLFVFIATLGLTMPNTSAAALSSEGARAGSASALLGTVQFGCAVVSSTAVSLLHNGSAAPMCTVIAVAGSCAFGVHRLTVARLAQAVVP